jgi:hypothetical protein
MNKQRKFTVTLVLIFIVLSIFFVTAKSFLTKWGIDNNILLIGNGILFAVSIAVFMLQHKALQHSNPNVFIRSVMLGMMIKMVVSAAAVLIYFEVSGNNFSGAVVFIFMLLYFIYLIAEVRAIVKLNKKPNA